MATRYQVSLAHQACGHTGSVVWEERADAARDARPIVVSLPRGFVSVTADDGSIEIVCSGCAQTVAAATFNAAAVADQQPRVENGQPDEPNPEDAIAEAPTHPVTASDLEMLFAEHPDVPPIRGDSIPNHLVDRLRHLAGRLRGGTA
jgi:hypothetical protein